MVSKRTRKQKELQQIDVNPGAVSQTSSWTVVCERIAGSRSHNGVPCLVVRGLLEESVVIAEPVEVHASVVDRIFKAKRGLRWRKDRLAQASSMPVIPRVCP
jgi:hypothetical protein